MSRYNVPKGPESEFEPGSNDTVLKNKLGIIDENEMNAVENAALLHAQKLYYTSGVVTVSTRFTAQIICQMHKDWLGQIYEWAGRYRTLNISKGDWQFPPPGFIAANMAAFEKGKLADYTPCRPRSLREVARSIAIVHAELLLIHPFREGNGRTARWLADLMAVQANLPPPLYKFYGEGSEEVGNRYLNAVIKGYVENYDDLTDFFVEAITLRTENES